MKRPLESSLSGGFDSDESGAVLPLTALLLVVLVMFAALTVDLGGAWAERRQDQSAVDAAAMAGALEYVKGTPSSAAALQQVKDYAFNSLGITDSDWLYPACEDPGHYDLIDPSIECISLGQGDLDGAILRVRLPDQEVSTSFARVIGKNSLLVNATAEAQVDYIDIGIVRPWSVPSNPSSQECFGTPPDGHLSDPDPLNPCGGPEAGNFGLLDSPWFGAPPPFSPGPCIETSQFASRTSRNIALGLDHIVVESPDPTVPTNVLLGKDDCDAISTPSWIPWVLNTRTGNGPGVVAAQEGLIGDGPFGPIGSDSELGLLRQPTGLNDGNGALGRIDLVLTSGSAGELDNVGLWEYLDASSGGACDPSNAGFSVGGRTATEQMITCIESGIDPTFIVDLLESPRFAVVPSLEYIHCDNPSDSPDCLSGNEWLHILDFVPVYLQGAWFTCGNPTLECLFKPTDYGVGEYTNVFFPGEGAAPPVREDNFAAPSGIDLKGVSAIVLDWDWLTPENAEEILGDSSPFKVRLYK